MCSRLPHAYSKSRSPSFPVPRSPRPLLFHPDYCYFRTRFDDPLREVQVVTLVFDTIVGDLDPFSHPLSFPSLRSVEQSDNERTVSVNLINLADISAGRRRGWFLRVSRILVRYARTRRNWITFDSGSVGKYKEFRRCVFACFAFNYDSQGREPVLTGKGRSDRSWTIANSEL